MQGGANILMLLKCALQLLFTVNSIKIQMKATLEIESRSTNEEMCILTILDLCY